MTAIIQKCTVCVVGNPPDFSQICCGHTKIQLMKKTDFVKTAPVRAGSRLAILGIGWQLGSSNMMGTGRSLFILCLIHETHPGRDEHNGAQPRAKTLTVASR